MAARTARSAVIGFVRSSMNSASLLEAPLRSHPSPGAPRSVSRDSIAGRLVFSDASTVAHPVRAAADRNISNSRICIRSGPSAPAHEEPTCAPEFIAARPPRVNGLIDLQAVAAKLALMRGVRSPTHESYRRGRSDVVFCPALDLDELRERGTKPAVWIWP